MNDAAIVRVRESACNVFQDRHRFADRHCGIAVQTAPEREAVDERHSIVWEPGGDPRREHGNDIRMLQLAGELDLALESLGTHSRCKLRSQDFHRDLSAECDFLRDEQLAQASAAELPLDAVGSAKGGLQVFADTHVKTNMCVGLCIYQRTYQARSAR